MITMFLKRRGCQIGRLLQLLLLGAVLLPRVVAQTFRGVPMQAALVGRRRSRPVHHLLVLGRADDLMRRDLRLALNLRRIILVIMVMVADVPHFVRVVPLVRVKVLMVVIMAGWVVVVVV